MRGMVLCVNAHFGGRIDTHKRFRLILALLTGGFVVATPAALFACEYCNAGGLICDENGCEATDAHCVVVEDETEGREECEGL